MAHNERHHDRVASAILDAAAEELATHGPQVAMAAVAERAGVSRATVYNYFESREALLTALQEAAIHGVRDQLDSLDVSELSPPDAFAHLASAMVTAGIKFQVMAIPASAHAHDGVELLRPVVITLLDRARTMRLVARGVTDELAFGMFLGLVAGTLRGPPVADPDVAGRRIATLLFSGVSADLA